MAWEHHARMARDTKYGPWCILTKRNRHARLRLFCFPYAGGSASIFQSWHAGLPDHVEVHAIQLPGRANRISEVPLTRVWKLVALLVEALMPLLDRPFAFFGHSLGAILGFEVARRLRCDWEIQPERLFVSGRRAPQIPDTDPPCYFKSDEDFLARLDDLKGTHPDVRSNTELVRLLLPTLRADFELAETYQYLENPRLTCPITVFGGRDDEETMNGRLEGWRLQTSGDFALNILDGGHFFIHTHENDLLSLLRLELSGSRGTGNSSSSRGAR